MLAILKRNGLRLVRWASLRRLAYVGILTCLIRGQAFAQPDSLWCQYFRYFADIEDVIQTRDGGYALFGSNFINNNRDIYLVRTDSQGDTLWTKEYETADWDFGYAIVERPTGGFVLSCRVYTPDTTDGADILFVDETGELENWFIFLGDDDQIRGNDLITTSDSCYVICGEGPNNSYDGFAVKFDDQGRELWSMWLGGNGNDDLYSIRPTSDGGFITCGTTESFGSGRRDPYVVKVDRSGDVEWQRGVGTDRDETGSSCVELSNGNYAVVGTWLIGFQRRMIYVVCFSADGNNRLWEYYYSFNDEDDGVGYEAIAMEDGGVLVAGSYEPSRHSQTSLDILLFRLSESGEPVWDRRFFADGIQNGVNLITTSDSGYALVSRAPSGPDRATVLFLKTSPDRWNDVQLLDPAFPSQFTFSAPYPNPFNNAVNISYQLSSALSTRITVIDLSGNEVETLWNGRQTAGQHSIIWQADNQASGIYFLRLEAGQFVKTMKMTLAK